MSKSRPPQTTEAGPSPALISAAVVVLVVVGVLIATLLGGVGEPTAAAPTVAPPTEVSPAEATPAPAAVPPGTDAQPSVPPADTGGAGKPSYSAAPEMAIDPTKNYTATITMAKGGDIVITLRPDLAPETVNAFVFLSQEGFYDGLTFHRVIPGFVAQGGDPTGTGMGGPGYTLPAEFSDTVLFDRPGLLAMARTSDPNSAGSQFFITLAPTPNLNSQYTIFGEVVEGQDVVEAITPRDPDQNPATPGDAIQTITITEG